PSASFRHVGTWSSCRPARAAAGTSPALAQDQAPDEHVLVGPNPGPQAPWSRDEPEVLDTGAPGLARREQLMDPREMAILRNAADPGLAAQQLPKIKEAVDRAQGTQVKAQATAAWRQVDSLQRRLKKRRLSAGSIPDAGKEQARRNELLGGPRLIDASTRHEGLDLPEAAVEDRRLEAGGDDQFRVRDFNMPGDTFNIDDQAQENDGDEYFYSKRILQNPAPYGNHLYRELKGQGFKPKDNLTDEEKTKMSNFVIDRIYGRPEREIDGRVIKKIEPDPQARREIQQLDRKMARDEYPDDVMKTKRALLGEPKKKGADPDVMDDDFVLAEDPFKNNDLGSLSDKSDGEFVHAGDLDGLPTEDARKNMAPITVDDREVFAHYDHQMPKNPTADDKRFGKYGAHRPFGVWRDKETNQVVDASHVQGPARQYEERWMQPIREDQRVQAPDAGWDALKKPGFGQTQAMQDYRDKKAAAQNVVADARKKMKDDEMLPAFVEKSAFGKKEWKKQEEAERLHAELQKAALRARIRGANPTGLF
ncbi:MAG: hypothetical protein WCG77_07110, partial [Actinomycetes bacterium]